MLTLLLWCCGAVGGALLTASTTNVVRVVDNANTNSIAKHDPIDLLLSPLSVNDFLQSHWQSNALVIYRSSTAASSSSSSSSSTRFDSWFNMHRLLELFSRAISTSSSASTPESAVINDDFRLVKRVWLPDQRQWWSAGLAAFADRSPQQLLERLAAGFTFVFNRIEMRDATVQRLCHSISTALGQRLVGCGANAYASPAAAQGFALHHDLQDAFIIQLIGQKRWSVCQFWPVPLIAPWQERKPTDDAVGAPCESVLLNAGDTLYVPRGMLHQASTVGVDEPLSLHLTIGIATTFTMAAELLHQLVRASTMGNERLENQLHAVVRAATDARVELRQNTDGDDPRQAMHQLIAFTEQFSSDQEFNDVINTVSVPIVGLERYVDIGGAPPSREDSMRWAVECLANDECLQRGVSRFHAALDEKRRQLQVAADAAIERSHDRRQTEL
jgi:hypothetical protein